MCKINTILYPVIHISKKIQRGNEIWWVCPECGRETRTYPSRKVSVIGDKDIEHQGGDEILTITRLTVEEK